MLLRVDDRHRRRQLLRRLLPAIDSATEPTHPDKQAWISAALTFRGLEALGVPRDSLASFPSEFCQGATSNSSWPHLMN